MNGFGQAVRDWWPIGRWIVICLVAATLALGKLFWDVEQLKTADDKALMQRIEAIENRTGDTALVDWNRWRATVDAKITGVETDIRDLQRRPIQ